MRSWRRADGMGSDAADRAGRGEEGLIAHYELDGSFSDVSGRHLHGRTLSGDPTFDPGPVGRSVTFDGETHVSFGAVGAFERTDPFSMAVWLRGRGNQPMSIFHKLDDAQHRADTMGVRRPVARGHSEVAARLTITSAPNAAKALKSDARAAAAGRGYHVALVNDGSGRAAGVPCT